MMKSSLRVDEYGTKRWYCGESLHRDDGPAVEYIDGDKYWYCDGKLHRDDGPAVEYKLFDIKNGTTVVKE